MSITQYEMQALKRIKTIHIEFGQEEIANLDEVMQFNLNGIKWLFVQGGAEKDNIIEIFIIIWVTFIYNSK